MITVNELFSGIGTQSLAFKYLGIPHKVVGMAEISKPAITAYETLHGPTRNYGDISEAEKLDYADLWTYSFPCFTGDTDVITQNGPKKIKNIEVGDFVYTHKNRLRRVLNTFNNGIRPITLMSVESVGNIETTPNHKFLQKKIETVVVKNVEDLYYLENGLNIEILDIQTIKNEIKYELKVNRNNTEICIGIEDLNPGDVIINKEKLTVSEYKVKIAEFSWVEVENLKEGDVVALLKNHANRKYYESLASTRIEMETKNFWWVPIKSIIHNIKEENVYDIEVEQDHSFIANGIAVHNCQDLSAGGKGAGLEKGTRSGLLWEVERLLEKSVQEGEAPKFLLLENVPDLVRNSKHKKGLDKWLDKLVELGYDNYYCVLNAADYGVPQNRERLFVVSTRKDLEREIYFFNIEKQPLAGFKNFVEDWVNEYKGPLMIDSTISPYLIDNFTRDLENISRAIDTPIWTCECTSGFQDNRVGIWYSPTIRHQNTHTAIFYNNQIHKLTSREAWRFMGIKDEDYQKVEDTGLGKTVIYGLAGNAIVVNVLMEIYKILFIKGVDY